MAHVLQCEETVRFFVGEMFYTQQIDCFREGLLLAAVWKPHASEENPFFLKYKRETFQELKH